MSAVIGLLLLATRWPSALRNGLFARGATEYVSRLPSPLRRSR